MNKDMRDDETWQEWAARTCPDADYQQLLKRLDMQTNAEKQRQYRKRQADLGRSELRGIYATAEEKKDIKQLINDYFEGKDDNRRTSRTSD